MLKIIIFNGLLHQFPKTYSPSSFTNNIHSLFINYYFAFFKEFFI